MRTVQRCWITLNWNDELETPNDEGMTNTETRRWLSSFGLRVSFLILISSFDIKNHKPEIRIQRP